MKVIDAFVFYNELEMLNYRLETLSPYVDFFVLVEATYTHNGEPKPLYFQENKSRFAKFLHKIIHVVVDYFPHKEKVADGRQWENEAFQRDRGIARGIERVPGVDAQDYVVCSDLDEIVDPAVIKNVRDEKITGDCHTLEMDFYYYNLTTYLGKWNACCLMRVWVAMQSCCRWRQESMIPNAGWHLSYFGDSAFIRNKLEHFGHQEYNSEQYKNEENIKKAIREGKDLFNRQDVTITKIKICDNPNLPPRIDLLVNFWGPLTNSP
jgi:beta-1,4-mannosyl-glycoprotein beta-1,4-N-acetylglucosaminyltransferase